MGARLRHINQIIKHVWPSTAVQRCLVHIQRNVRTYVTSRPRTEAGRAIYALALKLTKVRTLDDAAAWTANLHRFHSVYQAWMNEKTLNVNSGKREFTHQGVRRAYNSLVHPLRNNWLFTFLQPPQAPSELDYQ